MKEKEREDTKKEKSSSRRTIFLNKGKTKETDQKENHPI